jgi:RimJ/RimL family protein N-acetyltransferase
VLIPATVESLRAEAARDWSRFAGLLGVREPETWPPELYDDDAIAWSLRALEEGRDRAPWFTYYFVLRRAPRELVGAGGYMNPPDPDGVVELGYSVLAAHRRQGYASEATAALVACAFVQSKVKRVIAHTYPNLIASIGVLKRNGFAREGAGAEAGTVRYGRERGWRELLPWR